MNGASASDELLPHEAAAALWHRGVLMWKLWDQQRAIYDVVRELPLTVQTVVILFLCNNIYPLALLSYPVTCATCTRRTH